MPDGGRNQTVMQQESQQAVAAVGAVDLIAVAQKEPFPLHRRHGRSTVDFSRQVLAEDRSEMEVVVAFEVYDAATVAGQIQERFQHRIVLAKGMGGKPSQKSNRSPMMKRVSVFPSGSRGSGSRR